MSYYKIWAILGSGMYACFGVAMIFSMTFPLKQASFNTTVIMLISSSFNGFIITIPMGVRYITWQFWLSEGYFTDSVRFSCVAFDCELSASTYGYTLGRYALDIGLIIVMGLVYRCGAFILLVSMNKEKQK
jgi:hypothetical protein